MRIVSSQTPPQSTVQPITANPSVNAIVPLTITNTRNFTLPKTGGNGTRNLYVFGGISVIGGMALVVFILRKKRHA